MRKPILVVTIIGTVLMVAYQSFKKKFETSKSIDLNYEGDPHQFIGS